jgi:hypothetical protein
MFSYFSKHDQEREKKTQFPVAEHTKKTEIRG